MLFISSKYKILQPKLKIIFDQFLYGLAVMIILLILIFGIIGLWRPVQPSQYQQVIRWAEQASYPHTQHMAKMALELKYIRTMHYLKLVNTYQFESTHIRQYPAMSQEDE